MREPIDKTEYLEWKSSRATKQFVQELFEKREALKEGIVELGHSTDQARFVDIGRAQCLKDVIDHVLFDFNYRGRNEDEMDSGSA